MRGQSVLFTGKTTLRGEWVVRTELEKLVRDLGGYPQPDTRNRSSTLLVLGGLHPDVVKDKDGRRSVTLIFAEEQSDVGNHICVIDDAGFEGLVKGEPAVCLQFRRMNR